VINRIESELIARERRNKAQQQGTSVPCRIPESRIPESRIPESQIPESQKPDKKPLPPLRTERRTPQK
jgi:hypothetical protein